MFINPTEDSIFSREPNAATEVNGNTYFSFDNEIEDVNPFALNEYNFEEGFYNGGFSFSSPIDGEPQFDTPEAYGRQRIAALFGEFALKNMGITVLDLGSGTADLARTMPSHIRSQVHFVNSDISGPWTPLGEQSSLVKGMKKLSGQDEPYAKVTNVQFNFNTSNWPYAQEVFDYVATNIALHHVSPERKRERFNSLYKSLKPGGVLILNDVYRYNPEGTMLTSAGEKGPSECKGYVEPFKEMLDRLRSSGFEVDDLAKKAQRNEKDYTQDDLQGALKNNRRTMPISKAVWFVVAQRP